MTDQNKLSRREAIKILGAATGASLLANIPAKWSRPQVTGSPLPAFAQTSNCPAGSSALSVFVEGSGSIRIRDVTTLNVNGAFTDYPTGVTTTVNSGCLSECFLITVISLDATNVHTIVTLNGSIIYDHLFNNTSPNPPGSSRAYVVNGATGEHELNDNAPGCDLG